MAGTTNTAGQVGSTRPPHKDISLHMLLVGAPLGPVQELIHALRGRNCHVTCVSERELIERLTVQKPQETVVLLHPQAGPLPAGPTLRQLGKLRVPVMLAGGAGERIDLPNWLWDAPAADASGDEIFGRACTLLRMAGHARRMNAKLRKLKKIGRHLQYNYEQIDNELLLAGQLQRDFLPKQLPNVPGLQFVTLMRPYSWVSGDIYDVFRIDENHVGLYVADAVGHGVAAGLLTMFIKQALMAKQVTGNSYRVLSPAEVLANLNTSMAMHNLPNCQYVTICYAVVNWRTLHVQVARAAHPAPVIVERDGQLVQCECDAGCVIGVFPDQPFVQAEFDLKAGQKMMIFSDGVEEAFGRDETQRNRWLRIVQRNAGRDIHTIFRKLQKCIDRTRGSLHPQDDITAVGIEAAGQDP